MTGSQSCEERPWGKYRVLHGEPGICVKRIEIHPNSRLSLQKHFKRSEKWIILSGEGLVTLAEKTEVILPGSFIDVPCGTVHRIQNTSVKQPLIFIEVQFGEYLGEDDILRLDDDYGRMKK